MGKLLMHPSFTAAMDQMREMVGREGFELSDEQKQDIVRQIQINREKKEKEARERKEENDNLVRRWNLRKPPPPPKVNGE